MGLEHYRINVMYHEAEKEHIAYIPELPEAGQARAATRALAMEAMEELLDSLAQKAADEEMPLPEAIDALQKEDTDNSITVKFGRSLYQRLHHRSLNEGIEIEQIVNHAVAAYLEPRSNMGFSSQDQQLEEDVPSDQRPRRRRKKNDQQYQTLMNDPASFREYLRRQEREFGQGRDKRR